MRKLLALALLAASAASAAALENPMLTGPNNIEPEYGVSQFDQVHNNVDFFGNDTSYLLVAKNVGHDSVAFARFDGASVSASFVAYATIPGTLYLCSDQPSGWTCVDRSMAVIHNWVGYHLEATGEPGSVWWLFWHNDSSATVSPDSRAYLYVAQSERIDAVPQAEEPAPVEEPAPAPADKSIETDVNGGAGAFGLALLPAMLLRRRRYAAALLLTTASCAATATPYISVKAGISHLSPEVHGYAGGLGGSSRDGAFELRAGYAFGATGLRVSGVHQVLGQWEGSGINYSYSGIDVDYSLPGGVFGGLGVGKVNTSGGSLPFTEVNDKQFTATVGWRRGIAFDDRLEIEARYDYRDLDAQAVLIGFNFYMPEPVVYEPEPEPQQDPEFEPEPAPEVIIQDVFFQHDSNTLTSEGMAEVEEASRELKGKTVIVVGHASRPGSEEYNLRLSEARATTVANRLTGVTVDRILAMGELAPVCQEETPDCEARNRRVEILFQE